MNGLRCLAVLAALLASVPAGAQEALSIDAFFGRWEGSALGQDADEPTVGYGVRDLDVRISRTTDGFEITWFTVPRTGSLSAPETETQRRSTTAHFARSGPSTWAAENAEGAESAEGVNGPGASFSHSWARLEGRSLYIYVLEIDEGGIYQLSRYQRTLSPAGVMDLKFTRARDGTTVRRVSGSLMPAGD